MSRGRRYSGEGKLNYKKVFAVIIAIIVFIMAIFMIKNILTKAKNTKPVEIINYFAIYQDNKWGVLGSNGEKIIEPMYQEMPIIVDENKDVFLFTYDVNEQTGEYKTKAVNNKNEEVFAGYEKIESLENYDKSGNIWYENTVLKVQKNGLWGLINLEGKEILAPSYNKIETIKGIQNSLVVEKDGKLGLVNSKGIEILDTIYTQILPFGDDYKNGYITVNAENKYGLVNFSGEQVLANKYEKIDDIYNDKYFVIEENGKQKVINSKEEIIISDNFDKIIQIANSGVIFSKNNKYGLMNFVGEVVIDSVYDDLKEINTDIFSAKENGKYGIIDIEKNQKIPFEYQKTDYNKKAGLYIAEDEKFNSYIIDTNFETRVTGILSELNIEEGYMKVKVDDNYKYYNFKFEEKDVKDILKNNSIFVSKKDGKYGYVNAKGEVVIDYIYDDAQEQNKYGYAAVKKDGLWGAIDKNSNIVIEPYYNLDNNLKIDFIGKWHLGMDLNMNYYCEK